MNDPPPLTRAEQIAVMRGENPDIWDQIDALCAAGADVDTSLDRLIYPKGRCARCGYELYGNVSGVCPECGAPAEPSRQERRLRSCQLLEQLQRDHAALWSAVEQEREHARRAELERSNAREAEERDRSRRRAMKDYLALKAEQKHKRGPTTSKDR